MAPVAIVLLGIASIATSVGLGLVCGPAVPRRSSRIPVGS
jgi:hypothetical protein